MNVQVFHLRGAGRSVSFAWVEMVIIDYRPILLQHAGGVLNK